MKYLKIFERFDIKTNKEVINYIKDITPIKENIPDYFLKLIKDSKKDFKLTKLNIKDVLKKDKDVKEYVKKAEDRYDEYDYEELGLTIDHIYDPIVVLNDEVLDGYSRIKTLIDLGEEQVDAWVA